MIYLILLAVNFLFISFIKSGRKYWLLSIPLWLLLISSFVVWRIDSDRRIDKLEAAYWDSAGNKSYGEYNKWEELRYARREAQKQNMQFVYLIALQTFVTFVLQIVGYERKGLSIYRWSRVVFGVLFVVAFLLVVLMGIVPMGGMVR